MAGTAKRLRQRGTTFFVRIGAPKELREIVGKSELHDSLGGNRREAERRSHAALARFHGILDETRLKLAQGADTPPRLSRALNTPSLARHHYQSELDLDAALRDAGAFAASSGFDPNTYERIFAPGYIAALKEVAAGIAPDDKIAATIGWAIDAYAEAKLTKVVSDTPEWRALARTLAGVQIEVMRRTSERNAGEPEAEPAHSALKPDAQPAPAPRERVRILDLLDGYLAELRASGRGA